MAIPARVHFCWIGPQLPWAYVFAVLSAAERSGMREIILHHTDALDPGPELDALLGAAGVELHRIDPIACLTRAGEALGIGEQLTVLYRSLDRPAARADILRAAILFQQGGIYLDLDTVTVSSLRPLLDARQFVGCEYIVWPYFIRASRSPAQWARALTLDLSRKAMRHMAGGWEAFRRVQRFYYRGINNAVLGAEPDSNFFAHYLRAMSMVAPDRLRQAYALGPDLLQELIDHESWSDLIVHDPEVFYPLPPEISEHWFRIRDTVRLDSVLSPATRIVHWYASVRTKPRVALVSPAYVKEHRERQFYSALVCSCISNLPAA
jgi:Glycosyltransferase sugar-binding region containing DXD motif